MPPVQCVCVWLERIEYIMYPIARVWLWWARIGEGLYASESVVAAPPSVSEDEYCAQVENCCRYPCSLAWSQTRATSMNRPFVVRLLSVVQRNGP